jgi:hypothetical protein
MHAILHNNHKSGKINTSDNLSFYNTCFCCHTCVIKYLVSISSTGHLKQVDAQCDNTYNLATTLLNRTTCCHLFIDFWLIQNAKSTGDSCKITKNSAGVPLGVETAYGCYCYTTLFHLVNCSDQSTSACAMLLAFITLLKNSHILVHLID